MKALLRIAFALGLTVMVVLIVSGGARSIMNLLAQAGWLLLILIPFHTVPLLLDVLGWRALMLEHISIRHLFLIAWVREAINRLLPVANVGGEIVGIRLLAKVNQDGPMAAATVVVETLLTLVSQYLFFLIGLECLSSLTHAAFLTNGLLLGLAGGLVVIVLSAAMLRSGSMFTRVDQLAKRMLGGDSRPTVFIQGASLDKNIRKLLAARANLARAIGWQLAGLLVGATETWLALRWLGHPVGVTTALGLESLTQTARSAAFIVPAGVGVQEASLLGLGHLIGMSNDLALALSLAKRSREILFGAPGLLLWPWLDGRNGSRASHSHVHREERL